MGREGKWAVECVWDEGRVVVCAPATTPTVPPAVWVCVGAALTSHDDAFDLCFLFFFLRDPERDLDLDLDLDLEDHREDGIQNLGASSYVLLILSLGHTPLGLLRL